MKGYSLKNKPELKFKISHSHLEILMKLVNLLLILLFATTGFSYENDEAEILAAKLYSATMNAVSSDVFSMKRNVDDRLVLFIKEDKSKLFSSALLTMGVGTVVTAGVIMLVPLAKTGISTAAKIIAGGTGLLTIGAVIAIAKISMSTTDNIYDQVEKDPLLFLQLSSKVQSQIFKNRPDVTEKVEQYAEGLNLITYAVEEYNRRHDCN